MRSIGVSGMVLMAGLSAGCLGTSIEEDAVLPNITSGGTSTPIPTGAGGSGGGAAECLPVWDPGDDVKALGRVLVDGSDTGVLRPGSVNVKSVLLWNAQMQVTFVDPLPSADYTVFANPTGSGNVVTFVPTYVAFDQQSAGFKLMAFNLDGEPTSWETPTTVEPSFVVY